MLRQPAKALAPDDVRRALDHVRHQRHPDRNRVITLLNFKAGLRACEIAGLTCPMALTSDGHIAAHLSVAGQIAKCGSGRDILLNVELARALKRLHH